jgi:hypothetical protein
MSVLCTPPKRVVSEFLISSFHFPTPVCLVADERPTTVYILIAAAAIVAVVGVLIFVTRPRSKTPSAPVLDAEQRVYLSQIVISDARMSAAENFLGHTVIYLDGQMTNQGSRTVRQIEIQMEFVDMLNQVVLRDNGFPLKPPMAPLKPGETRSFQVTFDRMPAEWNQAAPTITVKSVQF